MNRVSNGSDNGLLPIWHQAIIWTNAGILLIAPLGRKFSEILIAVEAFSFKKIYLKMSSGKWHPFCLGLNVLPQWDLKRMVKIVQLTFLTHFLEWTLRYFDWNVLRDPINNMPAMVQIMVLCHTGDKPWSEPKMTQFTDAYICITRPQGVNPVRLDQDGHLFTADIFKYVLLN